MTRDVVAVSDNTPIDIVARVIDPAAREAPAVKNGELIGIVSRVDLLLPLIESGDPC
jgi:CBS domain-containing protein